MIKTILIFLIVAVIIYWIFSKLYKDFKKNKSFCGNCSSGCSCSAKEDKK